MTSLPRANELRYLDPVVVARMGSMELRARTIVEGFLVGLHHSPYKGFSVEFSEYRQYIPGDDLSRLDWKVYARSDRYYVKKFEEETNVECHLLLDISGSMAYSSGEVTKKDYGSYLAASLAYLMNRQRDAIGLTVFDDKIVSNVPVSSRPWNLRRLLRVLDELVPGGRSDVSKPLTSLADTLSRRGMVVLISDLFDDPKKIIKGLRHLRFSGTDVIVFHVLDHAELTFPFRRAVRFRDLETNDEVIAMPLKVREYYLKEINDLIAMYKRELRLAGIDYCLVDTSTPLDLALLSYLGRRSRLH